MLSRLLRVLGVFAYVLLLVVVFGLAAYSSFSAFVRSGVTTVPSVVGMPRSRAADVLADQGLTAVSPADGDERYDDKIPAGHVARQTPDARTFVKRGSRVAIVMSRGPRRVEVPDLLGKTLPAAQSTMSGKGLALGRILGAYSPGQEAPGSVLEQDPEAGEAVAPAAGVNLLLSMAVPRERYVMPDLVYRNYEQVRPYFDQLGFKFGSVKFERYEGVAAGVILRQFPLPGHPVSREDAISLVVATADGEPGAEPAPAPTPAAAAPAAPGGPR